MSTSKKTTGKKKMPAKKTKPTPPARKRAAATATTGKVERISIRMYCLGTGDCFVIKFLDAGNPVFTAMIDCGSCQGTAKDFQPYIEDLASYVNHHLDLLVITHEHNDHVNGFAKCETIFRDSKFTIDEAWFAWTENPNDPGGRARKLQEKRKKMRMALAGAIARFRSEADKFKRSATGDFFKLRVQESNAAFLDGLDTLANINLPAAGDAGKPLPGMAKIKDILKTKKTATGKKTKISYLEPGQSIDVDKLPGFKFHILGPPFERDYIFKDGKEGTDVYQKKLNLYESSLAVTAFLDQDEAEGRDRDLPFNENYVDSEHQRSVISKMSRQSGVFSSYPGSTRALYEDSANAWRRIDTEWLSSAGSLALRLNSHINNTSLAMAVEHLDSGKVLLLPGDAEYGSWESWHAIEEWKNKGENGSTLAEDLLGRTAFYKVGHHLSYNGTALKLGIDMMPKSGLVSMATLDRTRIAKGWKSTMPNKYLLQELIKRGDGRLFIMNEKEIPNPPSKTLDPGSLATTVYDTETFPGTKDPIYKQYTLKL
jgi:beta-lactamase superfamily II metal-dependent hydrolase